MTRKTRRDRGVYNGSVIAGLRLEPELAQALVEYARGQAAAHGEARANVASAARDLLRRGLDLCSSEHSCAKEGYFRGLAEARAGLAGAGK